MSNVGPVATPRDLASFARDGRTPPANAIVVTGSRGALAALAPAPTNGQVATMVSGTPQWRAPAAVISVAHASPVGGGFVTQLVFDDTPTTGGLYGWSVADYVLIGLPTA